VNAEAVSGFDRDILVSARIDGVALGYPFSVVQTVDLRAASGLAQVIDGVGRKIGRRLVESAPAQRDEQHLKSEDKSPEQTFPKPIDFERRRMRGWTLIRIAATVPTLGLILSAIEGEGLLYLLRQVGYALGSFGIILGYPLLAGVGSLLIGSGTSKEPMRAIALPTILICGAAGAIISAVLLFVVNWLYSQMGGAAAAYIFSAPVALLPPFAAGLLARRIGQTRVDAMT
jgi:hypothetical protein